MNFIRLRVGNRMHLRKDRTGKLTHPQGFTWEISQTRWNWRVQIDVSLNTSLWCMRTNFKSEIWTDGNIQHVHRKRHHEIRKQKKYTRHISKWRSAQQRKCLHQRAPELWILKEPQPFPGQQYSPHTRSTSRGYYRRLRRWRCFKCQLVSRWHTSQHAWFTAEDSQDHLPSRFHKLSRHQSSAP